MSFEVFLIDDAFFSVKVSLLSIYPFKDMLSKKCFKGINLMSYRVFLVDDEFYSVEVPLLSTRVYPFLQRYAFEEVF